MSLTQEHKELIHIVKSRPELILENHDGLWEQFVEKFMTITDVDGNEIPFIPKREQRRFLEMYWEAKSKGEQFRCVTLKPRQIGMSSLCVMIFLVEAICIPNSEVLVAANLKDGAAGNIFNKHLFALRNMPQYKGKRNADRSIFAVGGSPASGRMRLKNSKGLIRLIGERIEVGVTLTGVHCSEAAHYHSFADFMTHLRPAIRTGKNKTIIIESTARVHGDAFHDEYNKATEGRGGWCSYFSPWYEDETYTTAIPVQEKQAFIESLSRQTQVYGDELAIQKDYGLTDEQLYWRRDTIDESGSLASFAMNYPSNAEEAFLSSDRPVFHVPSLNFHKERAEPCVVRGDYKSRTGRFIRPDGKDAFAFEESNTGTIEKWEDYDESAEYVWSADVAEGLPSGDFSVALIAKRNPFKVVAKIRGDDTTKLEILDFSRQLSYLLRDYGEPKGLPEINNHGHSVKNLLTEWGLGHCLMYESEVKEDGANLKRVGFLTNQKSKMELFDLLTDAMKVELMPDGTIHYNSEYAPIIPDVETINEMYQIVTDGKKIHARRKGETRPHGSTSVGYHDDLAISMGLLVLAHKSLPEPRRVEENMIRRYGRNHPKTEMLDWVEIHDPIADMREIVR